MVKLVYIYTGQEQEAREGVSWAGIEVTKVNRMDLGNFGV